jgi:hypothetical protein
MLWASIVDGLILSFTESIDRKKVHKSDERHHVFLGS